MLRFIRQVAHGGLIGDFQDFFFLGGKRRPGLDAFTIGIARPSEVDPIGLHVADDEDVSVCYCTMTMFTVSEVGS